MTFTNKEMATLRAALLHWELTVPKSQRAIVVALASPWRVRAFGPLTDHEITALYPRLGMPETPDIVLP